MSAKWHRAKALRRVRRGPSNRQTPNIEITVPARDSDYGTCPLSGEPIEDVLSAIIDPETGQPSNLESVIKALADKERLAENERICYIGHGSFGVVYDTGEGKKRQVTITRVIEYERSNNPQTWRKALYYSIKRDYDPSPDPLSTLYTNEQLRSFPVFGRISTH